MATNFFCSVERYAGLHFVCVLVGEVVAKFRLAGQEQLAGLAGFVPLPSYVVRPATVLDVAVHTDG